MRPPIGQIQVVLVVAAFIGVALDFDEGDLRMALDRRRDGIE